MLEAEVYISNSLSLWGPYLLVGLTFAICVADPVYTSLNTCNTSIISIHQHRSITIFFIVVIAPPHEICASSYRQLGAS